MVWNLVATIEAFIHYKIVILILNNFMPSYAHSNCNSGVVSIISYGDSNFPVLLQVRSLFLSESDKVSRGSLEKMTLV